MIAATSSSSVVIPPPSPVVTIFRGWKLWQATRPSDPHGRPLPPRAERAGRVLDHEQVGQLLHPRGPAEEVHGHDGFRPRPDLDLRRIDVHRHRVDVDEHRPQARERDDVRGRREGVGGDDDLVARLEPEREHGEVERRGAGGDGERVARPAGGGELPLELGDERAHRELAALEHLGDERDVLAAGVGPGEADCLYLLRYHSIVRASPSSSSTSGSQASSSRAFATFGMRSSTST